MPDLIIPSNEVVRSILLREYVTSSDPRIYLGSFYIRKPSTLYFLFEGSGKASIGFDDVLTNRYELTANYVTTPSSGSGNEFDLDDDTYVVWYYDVGAGGEVTVAEYDLGAVYDILLRIKYSVTTGDEARIYTSSDGSTWNTLASGSTGYDTVYSVSTRYIKLTDYSSNGASGEASYLYTIEAYKPLNTGLHQYQLNEGTRKIRIVSDGTTPMFYLLYVADYPMG